MIKTIFFDTSDTLYQSDELTHDQEECAVRLLAERKKMALKEAENTFNEKKEQLEHKLEHVTKAHILIEFGIARTELQEYLTNNLDPKKYLKQDQELANVIERLSKKYGLGILTNVNKKFAEKILEAQGVSPKYFSYFVTADNTINTKPHPEPFKKAIELCKNNPQEIVFVGDSYSKDIMPAKREGMKTIWVTTESDKKEADGKIKNVKELEKELKKI